MAFRALDPEWAHRVDARMCVFTASPHDLINRAHRALLHALKAARHAVVIANAYFMPDAQSQAALTDAALSRTHPKEKRQG